jgi:hypothetical protein
MVFAEMLEARQLLSAVPDLVAHPVDSAIPLAGSIPAGSASPTGYSPTQIKSAYDINGVQFGSVTGTGAGQTIAIVVAYDNPDLVDSTDSGFANSDLHNFDVAMGLADPPSFVKVDEYGHAITSSSGISTDPGWANEAALDVEWSHAIAPAANIMLIEAYSPNLSDLIQQTMQYATSVPSISVITMSFAINEFQGETTYDSYLGTPTGHQGITLLAASGDDGSAGGYPSVSPDVVSVGATTLNLSGNSYSSETGLNTSGGGISQYESKPSYQFGVTQSSTQRTTPDVSIDGDKNTGLSVYDSYNGGSATPWYKVGGTSASTPMWAGLIAIADQGRVTLGLGTLNGPTQTLPRLYSLNGSDFNDITTGNNGDAAGAGYDLVTGIGTPIADKLIPDLAGGNTVSGTIFSDTNANGTLNSGEPGLSGYTAFVDLYGTGVAEGADPVATSASDGTYSFTDLPGGTFTFTQPAAATGSQLTTATTRTLTLGFGSTTTGKNIGYKFLATQLAFDQQPGDVTVGDAIAPAVTVDVEGATGDILTSDTSAVTLALSNGGTGLGGTVTVNAVNGVATFSNITLASQGSYSLKATDGSLTSATSTAFLVSVAVGPAAKLVFEQQPSSVTAGVAISPVIIAQVEDANGNVVATDDSAVTLAIASGPTGVVLGGTTTVGAVNGIATFSDITLSEAGTFSLSVTDGALISATSTSFVVSASNSAQLAFQQQPTEVTAEQTITPAITVLVQDDLGNTITDDSSPVTLTIASGPDGAVLGGTTTVDAIDGVATFNDISVSAPGDVILNVTDADLSPATSNDFTVDPIVLVPAQLAFSQQPTAAPAGTFIRPAITVNVEDFSGDIVTTDNSAVTLSISTGPAGAALIGDTTVDAVNGVATFDNLAISDAGTYILDASDGSLTAAVSSTDTIAVTGSLAPAIASSRVPSATIGGSKVNDVVVVKETAAATATGTVTTDIYAADDNTLVLLGSVSRRLAVKAGKTYQIAVPVRSIPATLVGTYSVIASVTDSAGNTTTANTGATTTVAAPFVSLSETFSRETLPPAVVSGNRVNGVASVKVTNAGNINSTGPTTLGIYLSPDGLESDSMLVTSVTRRLTIRPNGSAVITVPLRTLPTTNGLYQILAQVTDPNGGLSAADSGSTVNIEPTTIAFNASAAAVSPTSIAAGKFGTLVVTIENTGNIAATGDATIEIGLSSDGITQSSQITSIVKPVVIQPGHHIVLHLRFTVPAATTAGSYFPVVTYIQAGASTKVVGAVAFSVT